MPAVAGEMERKNLRQLRQLSSNEKNAGVHEELSLDSEPPAPASVTARRITQLEQSKMCKDPVFRQMPSTLPEQPRSLLRPKAVTVFLTTLLLTWYVPRD